MNNLEKIITDAIEKVLKERSFKTDKFQYFKKSNLNKENYQNVERGYITEVLTKENSDTLGCGFFYLNNSKFEFLYPYDEALLVLNGKLKVNVEEKEIELLPGEIFVAKKNLKVIFSTKNDTKWFYVTYPP